MSLARAGLAALAAGSVALSCTSDLDPTLDGLKCSPGPQPCVGGYVCDALSQLCVRPAGLGQGGASGTGGAGDAGAAGSGASGGSGGTSATGGASGTAGSAGAGGQGGASGASGASGAPSDADAGDDGSSDACVPTTLFRDGDGDGVGDIQDQRQGCPEPGWVTQPGDCRDDLPDVFLGQPLFFAVPFTDVAGDSFDYDCSDTEEPDPDNSPLDAAPECAGGLATCSGSGYLPVSPARAGAGIESRCGSTLRRDCVNPGGLLACEAQDTLLDPSLAFRCH